MKRIKTQGIRSINKLGSKQFLIYGTVFAIVGTLFLFSSHAAGPTASLETENSNINSPATSVNDTNASGGRALKFQAGGSCALPKYPDASCTGVPAGTTLTPVNGNIIITTAGTTINNEAITGCVTVRASQLKIVGLAAPAVEADLMLCFWMMALDGVTGR
jgi:hypothetical protein